MQSLKVHTFPMDEGPCVKAVDKALCECGVERQAYYGGTLIGNHVHKCCKVTMLKK